MPTRARAVMAVVMLWALITGAPSARGGIVYPIDRLPLRGISLADGPNSVQVLPSSPLADFNEFREAQLGPADADGQTSRMRVAQRSALGTDRIEVSCSIDGYRALTGLDPGVTQVTGQSIATIVFDVMQPTNFTATFPMVTRTGFNVTGGINLFDLGSGERIFGVFPGQPDYPPIAGVLSAGRYQLLVSAEVFSLLSGPALATSAVVLDVPGPTMLGTGAAMAMVGGARRARRREELA